MPASLYFTIFLLLGFPLQVVLGFTPPDFSKQLFSMDGVLLSKEEEEEIVGLLVSVADSSSGDEEDGLAGEKAIALALLVDPVNRAARQTLGKMKAGERSVDEDGPTKSPGMEVAKKVLEWSRRLDRPTASKDELVLATFLTDVALESAPNLQASGLVDLAEVASRAGVAGWRGVLRGSGDPDALIAMARRTSVPDNGAKPVVAAGATKRANKDAAADLGFALAKSRVNVLSAEAAPAKGDLPVSVSVARVIARVEVAAEDKKMPELSTEEFSASSGSRGFDSKRLMRVIREMDAGWPARGDVILEVLDADFGLPARASELAIALAMNSLREGTKVGAKVLAIGGVDGDGSLAAFPLFPEMMKVASEQIAPYFLVVPASVEPDLVDFALAGEFDILLEHQVFLASSISEAARLATASPAESFQRALLEFGQIQDVLGPGATLASLRAEGTVERLRNIVAQSPNHATAAVLLRAAEGKLPARFSGRGTLRILNSHLRAWKEVIDSISLEDPQVSTQATEELLAINERFTEQLATLKAQSSLRVDPLITSAEELANLAGKTLAYRERGSTRLKETREDCLLRWQEFSVEAGELDETIDQPSRPGGSSGRFRDGGLPRRL